MLWVWVLCRSRHVGALGWPGRMSWGSWISSVRETFPVLVWDIGSANLSLRLKNLGVEISLIYWAPASLVCNKSVSRACYPCCQPGFGWELPEDKARLSLADFATWHSHHDCIWQRLFPSFCLFSVALSQTWDKGSWGMLPGHCPGGQPTCFLPGGTRKKVLSVQYPLNPTSCPTPRWKHLDRCYIKLRVFSQWIKFV